MKHKKRPARNTSCILLAMAFALSLTSCANEEPQQKAPVPDGEPPAFDLFSAEDYEYTVMYGSPDTWDDEKNLTVNLDNDGISEEFIITKGKKNEIILNAVVRNAEGKTIDSYNLWTTELDSLLPDELREPGSIINYAYTQISCCDIDEDGTKEVLVSVGDKRRANLTAIYEYHKDDPVPFSFIGQLPCESKVEYKGNQILWAYDALCCGNAYTVYRYDNETITEIETEAYAQ